MRRSLVHRFAITGAALPLLVTATACSSDSSGSSNKPVVVTITEKGGQIDPVGEVVKASTGQQIRLVVTSDAPDELHVHSDPEHEFVIPAGADQKRYTFTIDTPGTVVVESHELEVTVLKLEIS